MKKFMIGAALVHACLLVNARPKVDIGKLRMAFDAKLKDSVSARVKDIDVPRKSLDGTTWEFCGLVNAKNSYGHTLVISISSL